MASVLVMVISPDILPGQYKFEIGLEIIMGRIMVQYLVPSRSPVNEGKGSEEVLPMGCL
jgi:hypothetical protein